METMYYWDSSLAFHSSDALAPTSLMPSDNLNQWWPVNWHMHCWVSVSYWSTLCKTIQSLNTKDCQFDNFSLVALQVVISKLMVPPFVKLIFCFHWCYVGLCYNRTRVCRAFDQISNYNKIWFQQSLNFEWIIIGKTDSWFCAICPVFALLITVAQIGSLTL